jgi:hypothetical protein
MPNSRVPPRTCRLVFAALVGAAAVASATGQARATVSDDRQVCYKGVFKEKTSLQYRFVLDVGFHSPLVSERDEGGFPQATYTALGKHVASDRSYKDVHMDVANGAIIVTDKGSESGNYQSGARMALEIIGVRHHWHTAEYDCTTAEESATPKTWACSVRENGKTFDLTLSRLDKKDELCGFFEDGSGTP